MTKEFIVRKRVKKIFLLLAVPVMLFGHSAAANQGRAYVGLNLGFAVAPSAEFESFSSGVPTACDLHLAGGVWSDACARATGDSFLNRWGGAGAGHLAGLTVGYALRHAPLRLELEYSHRNNEYDDDDVWRPLGGNSPAKLAEFDGLTTGGMPGAGGSASNRLKDIESHDVFFNVYYDHKTDSRWTPYVGAGLGWSRTEADLRLRFVRDNDVAIESARGTVSSLETSVEDDLFGWQLLLGMDYAVDERLSAGVRFRYARFGEFEGERKPWDTLRNHESTVAPADRVSEIGDRNNTILWQAESDDIEYWGVTLNLRYRFDWI